jgi:hypothetical protein
MPKRALAYVYFDYETGRRSGAKQPGGWGEHSEGAVHRSVTPH